MNATLAKKRAVGWTLATIMAPLTLSWLLVGMYLGPWYARTAHRGGPPAEVLLPGLLYTIGPALWLTVGIWWLIKRKRDSFRALFATRTNSLAKDLLAGVVLGAAWVAIYGLVHYPPFESMFIFNRLKFISVPTSLSAGFCEEFLFRGFLFLIIARAGGGRAAQIVWSSVAFGLAHVHWGPWGMLWTTALGLSFAAARTMRGNVWPAVAAHSVLDLCVEPAMLQLSMQLGSR